MSLINVTSDCCVNGEEFNGEGDGSVNRTAKKMLLFRLLYTSAGVDDCVYASW